MIRGGLGREGGGPAIGMDGSRTGVAKATPSLSSTLGRARGRYGHGEAETFHCGSKGMSVPGAAMNGGGGVPTRGARTRGASNTMPKFKRTVGY